MNNGILYPPILNATEPAFIGGFINETVSTPSYMKVYFQFPIGFNNLSENPTSIYLHAYVTKKDGTSIINKNIIQQLIPEEYEEYCVYPYRETGIILNIPYYNDNKGYYILLGNLNFLPKASFPDDYEAGRIWQGFIPGDIYKVQLRFSTELYSEEATKQAVWLQQHNSSFSEWSNCCYIKCIAPMQVNLPVFNDYSEIIIGAMPPAPQYINVSSPTKVIGTIINTLSESNELFSFCRIRLFYGTSNNLIEDSGDINRSETSQTGFEYKFKYNFEEDTDYRFELGIVTENEYIGTITPIYFRVTYENTDTLDNVYVITTESDEDNILTTTWKDKEEDEGRVVLKILDKNENPERYSNKICICRANALDSFSTWEDIKIITLNNEYLNRLPNFSDYTIESGILYTYGLRLIDENGYYGPVFGIVKDGKLPICIKREFNYSFILGQGDKQLRLRFDNTIDSYKYQILDNKTETVGSQFAFFGRNANVYYQTFPIKGLISSCMELIDFGNYYTDKNNVEGTLYDPDIFLVEFFNKYNTIMEYHTQDEDFRNKVIQGQDLTFERLFRQEVLAFLQDGKPKLFKSPTEGNVIVRLMDVQCTPNKTLNRLIYNFSCNAHEFDKNTMENYYKYGFYQPKYTGNIR